MKKLLVAVFLFTGITLHAQEIDSTQLMYDSIEAGLHYQTGTITLKSGIGTLQIPEGFQFLDPVEANFVLTDLWGNPQDSSTLGMIVPQRTGVTGDDSWAFIVTFDELGFVKDDDADDIDYDDLLGDMQEDTKAASKERVAMGYEPIALVGWGAKPYYDQDKKVLHWAKEIKFGESEENTLNYNVRILGRKGVLVLNAVSSMSQLAEVQQNIAPIMNSFAFAEENTYDKFDPELDEVAAWTIGGLVAGKVLAKVGIFAFLLKYIKLIGLGVVGASTAAWKWYKRKTEVPTVRNISDMNQGTGA